MNLPHSVNNNPLANLVEHFPLADHTTLRLGGPARWAADGSSFEAICAALKWAHQRGLAVLPLGGGSNVVCADSGFDGLLLRLTLGGAIVSLQEPPLAELLQRDPSTATNGAHSQTAPLILLPVQVDPLAPPNARQRPTQGNLTQGNLTQGNLTQGNPTQGNLTQGNPIPGNPTTPPSAPRPLTAYTSNAPADSAASASNLHVHVADANSFAASLDSHGASSDSPSPVWVTVGAGVSWDAFVRAACERGWAGIECLSGIPGTVGATPIQNVGAYGQEVSETLFAVTCIDRESRQIRVFTADECAFGYRTSRFKTFDRGRYVVAAVTFCLLAGGPPKLAYAELLRHFEAPGAPRPSLMRVREAVLRARASKSMLLDPADPNTRNCGSFFLNPVVERRVLEGLRQRLGVEVPNYPTPAPDRVKIPAAWLIERAGFKRSMRQGNVGLSTRHALCLVAHSGASTSELLSFARTVRDSVRDQLGVELFPEPVFVGTHW